MPIDLRFPSSLATIHTAPTLLVLGRREHLVPEVLKAVLPEGVTPDALTAMVGTSGTGDNGRSASTWTTEPVRKFVVGVLPDPCSRHNAPSRAWAIPGLVRAAGSSKTLAIVAIIAEPSYRNAVAAAIAGALPSFSAQSKPPSRKVDVVFIDTDGNLLDGREAEVLATCTQRAAHWVDMPPDVLNTDRFVQEARSVAAELGDVSVHVVQGEALREQGLGGLYGVGRAAERPPALVVLDYAPDGADQHVSLVGKGITYDTGGLSIKTKTGMPGMKTDMGGAAAVLSGFQALVRLQVPMAVTAILCLAENAVGSRSIRPDDILNMLSGRTVEINNTDAEGRLVLADGVAWAVRYRKPNVVIDMATLTGAQGVATGRLHAAVMSNDADLESMAVQAGRAAGQLTHPVPFAPELFGREFASQVADMKNSVKDRSNAQVSCAGQFIGNHLGSYAGHWLHVDMASPAVAAGRGTGFGAAFLVSLMERLHATPLGSPTDTLGS